MLSQAEKPILFDADGDRARRYTKQVIPLAGAPKVGKRGRRLSAAFYPVAKLIPDTPPSFRRSLRGHVH
jgi:hypothetical protein